MPAHMLTAPVAFKPLQVREQVNALVAAESLEDAVPARTGT